MALLARGLYWHSTQANFLRPVFAAAASEQGSNPDCCGASEPEASERSSSLIDAVGSQKVNF